jgi:hypothetical protein
MSQTNPELAESLQQFITVWKKIGRPFTLVDQTDRPGLAITWPDTPFPFYNALFLTESLTDAQILQARLQQAEAYMRARSNGGLPLSLPGGDRPRRTEKRVWRSGSATCSADRLCSNWHPSDRSPRYRGRISALFESRIPPNCEVHGMHASVLSSPG